MVLDAVANFVRGNTDAAVDNSQTTISVVDASIFPDPATEGEYNVVMWNAATYPRPDQDPDTEILRVTAIDATNDDLTVVRAQETTTAAAHPDGSAIHLSPTAKMFSDIESEYTASGENFDGEGTSEFSNLQSLSTEQARISNAATLTVNIPTDYATLQDAIDDLSQRVFPDGTVVELNVESGHQPDAGIDVQDGYYGHFHITADGGTFSVGDNFEGNLIKADNAIAPTLATDVDMRDLGYDGVNDDTGCAISIGVNGVALADVAEGVTVNNPPRSAYQAFQGSVISANNTTIDGAGYRAIHVTHAATVSFRGGVLNWGDNDGLYASHGATINGLSSDISNSGGNLAVYAIDGSTIALGGGANVSGGFRCLSAKNNSKISIKGGTISGSTDHAVFADTGSSITLEDTTIDNSGGIGVAIVDCSEAMLKNVDVTNSTSDSIRALKARATVNGESSLSGAGGDDVHIQGGSLVSIDTGATFSTTNLAANTLHPEGIIFDNTA